VPAASSIAKVAGVEKTRAMGMFTAVQATSTPNRRVGPLRTAALPREDA
jgi:hypothetical protein